MAHKTLFSFLIATSINRNSKKINELMWSCLLRGPSTFNKSKMPENPNIQLIPQIQWELAYFLEITFTEKFGGLTDHIIDNMGLWEDFCLIGDP